MLLIVTACTRVVALFGDAIWVPLWVLVLRARRPPNPTRIRMPVVNSCSVFESLNVLIAGNKKKKNKNKIK